MFRLIREESPFSKHLWPMENEPIVLKRSLGPIDILQRLLVESLPQKIWKEQNGLPKIWPSKMPPRPSGIVMVCCIYWVAFQPPQEGNIIQSLSERECLATLFKLHDGSSLSADLYQLAGGMQLKQYFPSFQKQMNPLKTFQNILQGSCFLFISDWGMDRAFICTANILLIRVFITTLI